jgi:hypothetical protein
MSIFSKFHLKSYEDGASTLPLYEQLLLVHLCHLARRIA